MGETFAVSDLHIGHNKPFVYEDRGFDTIEEHDRALLENWNNTVAPEDTVYVLGDIMLYGSEDSAEYAINILRQLNGHLILVRGNHDTVEKEKKYLECDNVESVGNAALYVEYKYPGGGKYTFYLSHYPTLISHDSLKSMKRAVINLFGHTHQKEHFFKGHPYMYCVCLDAHDMRPVNFNTIVDEVALLRSEYGDTYVLE